MPYKIAEKRNLAENITFMKIMAPDVAGQARAGQFIVLIVDDTGERIPLTIYDYDVREGTVSIVFLEVGTSTKKLGSLVEGDMIKSFLGPLGSPFHLKKYGHVAVVGGGVGVPAIYPIAKGLRKAGNRLTSIIGARSRDLLILADEMESVSDELIITTDDGSMGRKGFVTEALADIMKDVDLVVAVGPLVMMRAVSELTRGRVRTIVSLNPIMVDGTGMCGGCRVRVGGEIRFACVDGPDFDGHDVDFNELMARNRTYLDEEAESHKCRIGLDDA